MNELTVVEPQGTPPNAREYVRVPRRNLIDVLHETANGKWQSMVLDSKDAAQLLSLLNQLEGAHAVPQLVEAAGA